MNNERQNKILELIEARPISTQTELANALSECGFVVTQTTVSRDIKLLELVKIQENNTYRYSVPAKASPLYKYQDVFIKSILSVNCTENIVVVKAIDGAAALVAKGIDSINDPDILGSVAGFDTVFVCAASHEAALKLMQNIKRLSAENA